MAFLILNDAASCNRRLKLNLQLFAMGGFSLDPNGQYCAYLRKSRADLEAEARGGEDTYKTHKRILFDLQKRLGITISEIYQERPATSGERISERPQMMRLLADVEDEKWDGVLVVEVERLARGDTMDQGIVAQAFKYSNTLIITPMRIYDPKNPDDEEYFEFGLFMSRREFKTITRRLQGGRKNAVIDGRFAGNTPPYGYRRVKLPGKGYTLEPDPTEAPIVQLIFSLYTDPDPEKRMGTARIARYLNETLKVPTRKNSEWIVATINGILRNPTYIGRVRWMSRPQVRKKAGKSRPRAPRENWIEVKGLHPPLITEEVFNRAQEHLSSKGHIRSVAGKISNPFAGLIRCGVCGSAIIRRPYNGKIPDMLICSRQGCTNVGSYLYLVEQSVLKFLKEWIKRYSAQWERRRPSGIKSDEMKIKAIESSIEAQRRQLEKLYQQRSNLHDLLEQKVYTVEVFMERSVELKNKIQEAEEGIRKAEEELEIERKRISAKTEIIPRVKEVLAVYSKTDDPAKKNAMLKSIIESITYQKDVGGRWSGAHDKFTLSINPKLPK